MHFEFRPMTAADAETLATWRYDGPLAFYDLEADGLTELFADLPLYLAAVDESEQVVGFLTTGPSAQVAGGHRAGVYPPDALDVGLGLRPDLVGHGLGSGFVRAGLDDLSRRVQPPPARFRLSVATFNSRAILAY